METDIDGPIHKLLYWNNLREHPAFNKNAQEGKQNRRKIEKYDNISSPAYRMKCTNIGPIRAQVTQFRLMPLLDVQEVQSTNQNEENIVTHLSVANTWTTVKKADQRIKSFPERLSTREMWLYMHSLRKSETPTSSHASPLPTLSRQSDVTLSVGSSASTPLPVFQRRLPTIQLLLRRPAIEKVIPLEADDPLFDALKKTIDLKPLPFKKTAESYKFYETHFPLLLTKVKKEGDRCTTPSMRSRTPESPMSILIARNRALHQRLIDLEYMMEVMEKETEDIAFVTELYDQTFDPTKWKWNKMDVAALRRRYTIDASLREM